MAKENKKSKKTSMLTTVGIGAGALVVGAGAYIYLTRNEIDSLYAKLKAMYGAGAPSQSEYINTSSGASTTGFPLQKGSRGAAVKVLQQALMQRYGNDILPKFGADADFDSETEIALKSKGHPTVLNESEYKSLIGYLTGKSGDATAPVATLPEKTATSSAADFPITYSSKNNGSLRNLQKALNTKGFTDYEGKKLTEDGTMGRRTASAMIKAGFKQGMMQPAGTVETPITKVVYDDFMSSKLSGLGAIYSNDLVVVGEFAPVYDLKNNPQGTAMRGELLGQVQGSDSTAFYFVTRGGQVRKVRKSLAAITA